LGLQQEFEADLEKSSANIKDMLDNLILSVDLRNLQNQLRDLDRKWDIQRTTHLHQQKCQHGISQTRTKRPSIIRRKITQIKTT
jgi:hypothetical protein